jgi:hypothetical protein
MHPKVGFPGSLSATRSRMWPADPTSRLPAPLGNPTILSSSAASPKRALAFTIMGSLTGERLSAANQSAPRGWRFYRMEKSGPICSAARPPANAAASLSNHNQAAARNGNTGGPVV